MSDKTYQIQTPPNKMIPHTRTVLTPPAPYHHHRVLLYIVSLTRYITTHNPAITKSNFRSLSLTRIGFFGFRDTDFETDTFHFGPANHGGGEGAAFFLGTAGATADLV